MHVETLLSAIWQMTFSLFSFRYMCNLADIVQPIFMTVFGANIVTICVAMLSIQIAMVIKCFYIFFNSTKFSN